MFFDHYSPEWSYIQPGQAGFAIALHEIGHLLGLKHPQHAGLNGQPTFPALGLAAQDSTLYTVMSYNEWSPALSYGHPATPMPLDVLAIQALYGPNFTFHTGNDTYQLRYSRGVETVWDAGGVDQFDAGLSPAGATIDLREGAYSYHGGYSVTAVAYHTVIENARGSYYSDTITGNEVANSIDGSWGNDVIYGLSGNDTLNGGLGNDQLFGGYGVDIATYFGASSYFTITTVSNITTVTDNMTIYDEGTDVLHDIEYLQFSDQTIAIGIAPQVVYRFYNVDSGTHFYSASEAEKGTLISAYNAFSFEGAVFAAADAGAADSETVWRFYNPSKGTHFYTISTEERDQVIDYDLGLVFEGAAYNAFTSPEDDTFPLYRFYNTDSGTHFYTVSDAERDSIIATLPGFHFEGTAYYVEGLA